MFSLIQTYHYKFVSMPRSAKRILMIVLDAIFLPICLWFAYVLRLAEWWPSHYIGPHWWLFPSISAMGVIAFTQNRIYRSVLRYIGSHVINQIMKSVLFLCLFLVIAGFFVESPVIPRSIPVIFGLLCFFYVGATRYLYRHYYHWILHNMLPKEGVAIYGAGGAGVQLSMALADGAEYKAVAFFDDDPGLKGAVVHGLRVYHPKELDKVAAKLKFKRVLLAIPSASREEKGRVLRSLAGSHLQVLSVPSMADIVAGNARIDNLQAIEIEDLLGRAPVPPAADLLHASLEKKVVLVTGAAGSIGSELCRQIIRQQPSKLVLFDANEFGLYQIEREMSEHLSSFANRPELVAVLGNVCDKSRLDHAVREHGVQTMYHAAAYKHVPIVEQNVFAGIHNNVRGTQNACLVAAEHKVERFILISTDKAVRSTNVMGATKRLAELVVQDMAAQAHDTIFSMVRFGNVLGSSGSVVPLFRKQIAQGGPLTVTHPDVTRYFMTIPEAALLVIQAGSLARGGEVFLLDMGREVKISDLARQMILLSGLEVKDEANPDGDIEINYIGLRPGEKLREELLIGDAVSGTEHPQIMQAKEICLSSSVLAAKLEALREVELSNNVDEACQILANPATGYTPEKRSGHNLTIVDTGS